GSGAAAMVGGGLVGAGVAAGAGAAGAALAVAAGSPTRRADFSTVSFAAAAGVSIAAGTERSRRAGRIRKAATAMEPAKPTATAPAIHSQVEPRRRPPSVRIGRAGSRS